MRSAGVLLFRRTADGRLEVLLGHMGGPFWARKDEGAWSIPKGEHDADEAPRAAAAREFAEELGIPLPPGELHDLGEVRTSGGKRITAYALAVGGDTDVDPAGIRPGTFTVEWPPRSGKVQEFPEIDRVAWFDVGTAHGKIVKGQRPLLDRLVTAVPGYGMG